MFFPQSKATYAKNEDGTPNILIDDFPPYIRSWRDAGGIAIEMRADNFNSPEQVRAFLTKELNTAKEHINKPVKEAFNDYVNNVLQYLA